MPTQYCYLRLGPYATPMAFRWEEILTKFIALPPTNVAIKEDPIITAGKEAFAVAAEKETFAVAAEEETFAVAAGKETLAVAAGKETFAVAAGKETFAVAAEEETLAVAAGKETFAVAAEEETLAVAAEEETFAVAAEEETFAVAAGKETFAVAAEEETFAVAAGEETFVVAAEKEALVIAAEEETFVVAAEEETFVVAAEEETFVVAAGDKTQSTPARKSKSKKQKKKKISQKQKEKDAAEDALIRKAAVDSAACTLENFRHEQVGRMKTIVFYICVWMKGISCILKCRENIHQMYLERFTDLLMDCLCFTNADRFGYDTFYLHSTRMFTFADPSENIKSVKAALKLKLEALYQESCNLITFIEFCKPHFNLSSMPYLQQAIVSTFAVVGMVEILFNHLNNFYSTSLAVHEIAEKTKQPIRMPADNVSWYTILDSTVKENFQCVTRALGTISICSSGILAQKNFEYDTKKLFPEMSARLSQNSVVIFIEVIGAVLVRPVRDMYISFANINWDDRHFTWGALPRIPRTLQNPAPKSQARLLNILYYINFVLQFHTVHFNIKVNPVWYNVWGMNENGSCNICDKKVVSEVVEVDMFHQELEAYGAFSGVHKTIPTCVMPCCKTEQLFCICNLTLSVLTCRNVTKKCCASMFIKLPPSDKVASSKFLQKQAALKLELFNIDQLESSVTSTGFKRLGGLVD